MDASALVGAYLDELSAQRKASEHTRTAYARDLADLLGLLAGRPLDAIDGMEVRRAVARLHGRGLSGRSLARRLSAWRGFFRWLVRKHGFAGNPCEGVRPPKSPRTLPKALSPDQAAALLDAPADDLLELRDCAMFELFYSSGLRLSELAGLDCRNGVDLAAGEVTVRGKRDKWRTVPLGSRAAQAVQAWLARRGEIARAGEPALFVGRGGARLSPRMIRARLSRWGLKRGLPVHVHPHMLRHSFASHVLQSSGDLRAVQEMLGHASIATTQVYTHLDFQHLAKVYDQAHPRARKK